MKIKYNGQAINLPLTKITYPTLEQKPSINSVSLVGNKTSDDLSLASKSHTHDDRYYTESETNGLLSKSNLLDNPWFTVNQRGGKIAPIGVGMYGNASCSGDVLYTTSKVYTATLNSSGSYTVYVNSTPLYIKANDVVDGYVGAGYTVDRWENVAGTTTSVVDGGLKLSTTNSTTGGVFLQHLDNYTVNAMLGKNITLSIVASTSSTICRVRIRFGAENNAYISELSTIIRNGVSSISGLVPNNTKNISVEIWENNTVTDLIVKCVKLELGSVSTLANDTAPNLEEEKLKCLGFDSKLSKSGDTMTGDLYLSSGNRVLCLTSENGTTGAFGVQSGDHSGLMTLDVYQGNTLSRLQFDNYKDKSIGNALTLWTLNLTTNAWTRNGQLLHTGNMATNNYQKIINTTTAPTVGASSTYPNGTLVVVYE